MDSVTELHNKTPTGSGAPSTPQAIMDGVTELYRKELRIAPRRIGYFRFILEGYDNLALLTTVDERHGDVILRYPAGLADEVEQLLESLTPALLIGNDHGAAPPAAPPSPPLSEARTPPKVLN